jgi:hypothetical protein
MSIQKNPFSLSDVEKLVIKESSIVNSLNRNGSNCVYTMPTCPHDQDGYARKICGRLVIIIVVEMLHGSDYWRRKHQIEYYFDPSASWATFFHLSVRRIKCLNTLRPKSMHFLRIHITIQSKGSTDMFNLFILTPHMIYTVPLFSAKLLNASKARSEFAVFAQCLASCSTESSSIIGPWYN